MDNFSFYIAVDALVGEGGPFVLGIFLSGVVMWAIILERYVFFFSVLPRLVRKANDTWKTRADHTSWCARQIRQMLISQVGTVSGMLEVFDSMAIRGSADARTMASGVSTAMICTMTGLAVSISGLYPVHYFRTRAHRETELLSDKLSF
jgi:biopolymer transport protein ExbB